jgi:hypothetical protein
VGVRSAWLVAVLAAGCGTDVALGALEPDASDSDTATDTSTDSDVDTDSDADTDTDTDTDTDIDSDVDTDSDTDGCTWEVFDLGNLTGVWGESAEDVYAVGGTTLTETLLFRFDGTDWNALDAGLGPVGLLSGVWGASADDVFVIGEMLIAARYDGLTWDVYTLPFFDPVYGIWGSSDGDVYAVGGALAAAIAHFDGGTAWEQVAGIPGGPLNDVWGSTATDVWAVGTASIVHSSGGAWTDASDGVDVTTASVWSVWGAGADNVFAVGEDAFVAGSFFFAYDGDSWSESDLGALAGSVGLRAVGGRGADEVYVVGEEYDTGGGAVIRYDGDGFEQLDGPFDFPLADVWVASTSEVFAVGSDGAVVCR